MTKDFADELERLGRQDRFTIIDLGLFVIDNLPAILSALRGAEWQGIETHDGSEGPVLISVSGMVGEARLRDDMGRREWWWAGEDPGDYHADPVAAPPTHWRPLPPPPKGTDHE